uniref:Uncharacterized protein n=1 Tax=Arundo donax TaxID=35708 RepID=A0A0A8Z4R3_ARUDO
MGRKAARRLGSKRWRPVGRPNCSAALVQLAGGNGSDGG